MKHFNSILIAFASLFCIGCSQEDNAPNNSTDAFYQLSTTINKIGQKYNSADKQSETMPSIKPKKSVFWWIGRVFVTAIADVGGSVTIDKNGASWNPKQGIDTSKEIWDKFEEEPKKNDSLKITKSVYIKDSTSITMDKTAIPPLNGNLLEDNAGYVHNVVLINLYNKYGEEFRTMSGDEVAKLISLEYDCVIKEAGLTTKAKICETIDRKVVSHICDIVNNANNVDDFIRIMKKEYPECGKEFDILGETMNKIMSEQMLKDDINSYNTEVNDAITKSQIPEKSKVLLKSSIGTACGSSQLWTTNQ